MPPTEAEVVLRRQLEEANARAMQLESALVQRGTATVGSFLDGLAAIVNGAKAGDPNSRANLRQLAVLLEAAKSLSSGIVPVSGMPPPPNGR